MKPTASTGHRFQFQKSRQLFLRLHNETLSIVAMCVCNPDGSPVEINRAAADTAVSTVSTLERAAGCAATGALPTR